MSSIYETPFVDVQEVRGEEGASVPCFSYWRPDLESTHRTPLGLYNKWVSALARKFQELDWANRPSCPRQDEIDWINNQPISYWLSEEAREMKKEGFTFYGKESKRPLTPAGSDYGARHELHCLGCSKLVGDRDGRAVADFACADMLDFCEECFAKALNNWKGYNIDPRPVEHFKAGKLISHWVYDKKVLYVGIKESGQT